MSDPGGGFVAVLVLDLHFPEAGSLKAKRRDLHSIKAILHRRFGATVAETDYHELWQRARLTVALVSGSAAHLEEAVDHMCGWLDARCPAGVGVERMFASTDDLRDFMSTLRLGG
ncbi:MAG TPA: DUF503 domain-containing protein [Solirubrobacteraceae bacterium]|nr:DUF503 domain-containing protein [Solirubrobacteraceae bacterium]